MRKILAICLILTTLLGLIPVMALSASAADVPGDWTTYRAASEYPENSDKPRKPEAGCGSAIGTVFTGVAVLLLSCGAVLRKREDRPPRSLTLPPRPSCFCGAVFLLFVKGERGSSPHGRIRTA